MAGLSIGDLALGYQNRLSNLRLKSELGALSGEMTSGRVRDVSAALGGDLGALSGIESGLTTLAAFETAGAEAALIGSAVQAALATMDRTGTHIGPALVQAGTHGEATQVQATAADALSGFSTILGALNTRVADRAVFAGIATAGPAVADAETILAALEADIAGETTAAGIAARVDAWFDTPGGGFDTVAYLGSDTPLAPIRVGPQASAEIAVTAADAGLRDLMKGYAMAGLVARGALSGQHDERVALVRDAGERVLTGNAALADISGSVGLSQARIEEARTANAAETTALELARTELVSADPYRTATALQNVQTQLETLYAITGRMSRLSLAEYLR